MKRSIVAFAVAFAILSARALDANELDNVREVQTKLADGGFYFGQIDGAYSSELAAALSRYQIRNGLPITGQLDIDTSKALGAKAAVTTTGTDPARASETWRRLRKRDEQFLAKMNGQTKPILASAGKNEKAAGASAQGPAAPPPSEGPVSTPAPAQASSINTTNKSSSPPEEVSTERLRDYVAAFVLAGLDPQVGAETDFFAERVRYYDDGVVDRGRIRKDLERYDARWPERKFRLAGDITVERQGEKQVRVTFPLRFELRNAEKHSSGKIDKSLVIEAVGNDDLQIVAVNERKAE